MLVLEILGHTAFKEEVNTAKGACSAHSIPILVQAQHQTLKRSWHFPLLMNLMHAGLFDKGMD